MAGGETRELQKILEMTDSGSDTYNIHTTFSTTKRIILWNLTTNIAKRFSTVSFRVQELHEADFSATVHYCQ